ncbi:S8 family serine peptidase [Actinoplanes sp. NPDC049265]|uniref:S8 family serine peptidase n=1 Tax=Actinoplanes sp. NPDC049265 TaxID=3363902 RepID=UPI00370FC976
MDIVDAHKISTGQGITVGLIDTGVNVKHRDLKQAVLPGLDTGTSGGDGRSDYDGHGTQMAGVIAGRGHDGGSGVLGIAPSAELLPVSITLNGLTDSSDAVKGLDFAVKHGAKVINMSFTMPSSPELQDAVRRARAADVVLVAGAGNKNQLGDGAFPALYHEVLSVGAIDRKGKIADVSVANEGVDIVAPGVDILSTSNRAASGYNLGTGTSDATAIVSGAAALIRAKYPDLSAADVVHRLTATATDAGPKGRDDSYGYGRLNLMKALTADVPLAPADAAAATAAPTGSAGDAGAAGPEGDDDLPRALPLRKVVPVVLGVGAGLVVLIVGIVVVVLMMRRRRT